MIYNSILCYTISYAAGPVHRGGRRCNLRPSSSCRASSCARKAFGVLHRMLIMMLIVIIMVCIYIYIYICIMVVSVMVIISCIIVSKAFAGRSSSSSGLTLYCRRRWLNALLSHTQDIWLRTVQHHRIDGNALDSSNMMTTGCQCDPALVHPKLDIIDTCSTRT